MNGSVRFSSFAARAGVAVLMLLALGHTLALAQGAPPSRAFDRLFAPEETGGSLALNSMYGLDSQSGSAAAVHTSPVPLGTFFGISPSASMGSEDFSLDGGTVVRRYTDTGRFKLFDAHGGGSMRMTSRRNVVRLLGSVSYAPFAQFLASPSGQTMNPTAPERAGHDRPVTNLLSLIDVGRQFGRRVMLSGGYSWQYRHLGPTSDPSDTLGDTQLHTISTRLSRQLGRHSILYGGYGTRISREEGRSVRPLRSHDISFGVDRSQQLKFSRRTTLQFSTGSSIVEYTEGFRLFAIGSAVLRHQLSRTWTVGGTARRGVAYLEGIREPVFSDTLGVSIGGAIGTRLDVQVDGGYSKGEIGLSSASSGFRTYSASTMVRALLTRRLAAFGQWTLYDQHFGQTTELPGLFEPILRRQGVRLGILLNVPLQSARPEQRGAR